MLLLARATPVELAMIVAARGATVLFTAPTAYRAILASGNGPLLRGVLRQRAATDVTGHETAPA